MCSVEQRPEQKTKLIARVTKKPRKTKEVMLKPKKKTEDHLECFKTAVRDNALRAH